MELDALAWVVDARVHHRPADRRPARVYAVVPSSTSPDGILLRVLATGDPHRIIRRTWPPAGLVAIALSACGWVAPMSEDGEDLVQPSAHPERRRLHHTIVVAGDGEDASILRAAGQEPVLLRGACGAVHELLLDCWASRPDARRSRTA